MREGVNGMRIAVWVVDQDPGYMIGTGAPLMKDEVDKHARNLFCSSLTKLTSATTLSAVPVPTRDYSKQDRCVDDRTRSKLCGAA